MFQDGVKSLLERKEEDGTEEKSEGISVGMLWISLCIHLAYMIKRKFQKEFLVVLFLYLEIIRLSWILSYVYYYCKSFCIKLCMSIEVVIISLNININVI